MMTKQMHAISHNFTSDLFMAQMPFLKTEVFGRNDGLYLISQYWMGFRITRLPKKHSAVFGKGRLNDDG